MTESGRRLGGGGGGLFEREAYKKIHPLKGTYWKGGVIKSLR